VCDGLDGETFWLVAQRGRSAGWVQNIEANPRVRVRVSGLRTGWRAGTAHILDSDDPRKRQRILARANPARRLCICTTKALNTTPLTVRIDLDTPLFTAVGRPARGARRCGAAEAMPGKTSCH
jgi:hypothetical protein